MKNLLLWKVSSQKYWRVSKCKADLDESYGNIAEGVKIRTKCQWYENNKKLKKYFLNFEQKQAEKFTIRRLVTDLIRKI